MRKEIFLERKYKKIFGLLCTIVFLITVGITPIAMGITIGDDYGEEIINYYFVTFNQREKTDIINYLEESFLDFEFYYQDNTYLVKMDENMFDKILSFSSVESVKPYLSSDKISPDLKSVSGEIKLKVILHKYTDIMKTIEELNNFDIKIEKINEVCQNYILCSCDAELIDDIASMKNVYWIDEFHPPMTDMNRITSNTYIGIDTPQVGGYKGDGVLAEVQDAGIDFTHPDLAPIIYTDGTVGVHRHGTCTSGIMFGDGSGNINAQGVAFEATGAFSDWYTGRALSISNLWNGNFNEGSAGMNGVVQSNSWHSGTSDGTYVSNTMDIDQAAWDFPHVLSTWSAGNSDDGTAEGWISRDGMAKNVICVGGVDHKDTASLSDDEWKLYGMGNTPSRGPAADNRQKPDLCGPFDWILTVDRPGSDGYVSGDYYDDFGGTSGATPIVGGCAVLTYDMYQDNYFDNNPTGDWPFSCTIKALLIADAYQYPLTSASRNAQGWGTPDMEYMYDLGKLYHIIEEYPESLDSGETWTRSFYISGNHPLKATLAWIDPAAPASTGSGRSLINNLDLKIESPSGIEYWGNNGLDDSIWSDSGLGTNHWSTTSGHRDDLNNVENVFIQSPQRGTWTVEITGRTGDVPQGPQDFSLVLSGASTDNVPPEITIITPSAGDALQDGITFSSEVTDPSGVDWVTYSIRLPTGGTGTIIDPMFESMSATDMGSDIWQLLFDTTQLPDGNYLLLVDASDILGNEGYKTVTFSIRNWAVLELLPNTPNSKAGRTMPVKFSIRIAPTVDPAQPFVRNEELTIKIYIKDYPGTILQTSTYGIKSIDYRINSIEEHYITNFKTLKKKPRIYVVEIWRNDMLIGSFEFETVK